MKKFFKKLLAVVSLAITVSNDCVIASNSLNEIKTIEEIKADIETSRGIGQILSVAKHCATFDSEIKSLELFANNNRNLTSSNAIAFDVITAYVNKAMHDPNNEQYPYKGLTNLATSLVTAINGLYKILGGDIDNNVFANIKGLITDHWMTLLDKENRSGLVKYDDISRCVEHILYNCEYYYSLDKLGGLNQGSIIKGMLTYQECKDQLSIQFCRCDTTYLLTTRLDTYQSTILEKIAIKYHANHNDCPSYKNLTISMAEANREFERCTLNLYKGFDPYMATLEKTNYRDRVTEVNKYCLYICTHGLDAIINL